MDANTMLLASAILTVGAAAINFATAWLNRKKEIKIPPEIKPIPKDKTIIKSKRRLAINKLVSFIFSAVAIIVISYQLYLLYGNDIFITQKQIVAIGFKFFLLFINILFIAIAQSKALFWRWVDNLMDSDESIADLIKTRMDLSNNK
jgi:hypothetical protein